MFVRLLILLAFGGVGKAHIVSYKVAGLLGLAQWVSGRRFKGENPRSQCETSRSRLSTRGSRRDRGTAVGMDVSVDGR